MARKAARSSTAIPQEVAADLQVLLGYLNFSAGNPDPGFHSALNRLHGWIDTEFPWNRLRVLLGEYLRKAEGQSAAFADTGQVEAVLKLVFDEVAPEYRRYHRDLLFHLPDGALQQPFFLARLFEATLAQGPPWDETDRIVAGALKQLNDFIGHRPIAVLESGRRMQPYPHERFRPVPIYIQQAGVAVGKYQKLIQTTLDILRASPPALLRDAYFDLDQLQEVAIDVRAYDQSHPVYKRTNYTFGEWDPHCIDNKGLYHRFIVRQIVVDALVDWIEQAEDMTEEEALYQAAAALCGTMLMASSISGAGPDTHSSDISLTTLLPKVARQRDAFYARLMESLSGLVAEKIIAEARVHRQPFGRVRQHLNLFLADYGARQLQHVHTSLLYARMGYPEESMRHANTIPSSAARIECEIQCAITAANIDLDHNDITAAAQRAAEIPDLIHRGIGCGALVDPWNILGFQGLFPLFTAREDSIVDPRVDVLIDLVDRVFSLFARLMSEAAAAGDRETLDKISTEFHNLADEWDRYATTAVADLPPVSGQESWQSASHVAEVLAEWRTAGESAGDIAFWRQQVERFQSPKSYALVVSALLDKGDIVASMGLLIQWLSEGETVSLESGNYSFHILAGRWLEMVLTPLEDEDPTATSRRAWPKIQKFFDYLEANAGAYWSVPSFNEAIAGEQHMLLDDEELEDLEGDDDEDEEANLFEAAYEDVTFKESARDGRSGDTVDDDLFSRDSEFDSLSSGLRDRLVFLANLSHLRQIAAANMSSAMSPTDDDAADFSETLGETILHWRQHDTALLKGLKVLIESVSDMESDLPMGDQESLIEFDRQSQMKIELLRMLIIVFSKCGDSSRTLLSCLPDKPSGAVLKGWEQSAVPLYRAIFRSDVAQTQALLPPFLKAISRRPLLYVPLHEGGDPLAIARVRTLQSAIQFLLEQLPRLGLLRETWHTLKTAQLMERRSNRAGVTVTEFAGLFSAALRNSLSCVIRSSADWENGKFTDEQLIQSVGEIGEYYLELWLDHSSTMRISTVEALNDRVAWSEVKWFIRRYGQDLFYGGNLTLGGIRAILRQGVESYLDMLEEDDDPLNPMRLVEDLSSGELDREDASDCLEIILRCLQDKYERFIEYNSTTTQSDYGENIYQLLAFLRLEADYDRKAWDLTPVAIVHEALAREGAIEAAEIWQDVFRIKTETLSETFLRNLARLERACSIKLPSLRDRLNERFIKPLTLDRILALVPEAIEAARLQTPSASFETLSEKVDDYLESTTGSAMDIPPWLYSLENEVAKMEQPDHFDLDAPVTPVTLPKITISMLEFSEQVVGWDTKLADADDD
ncbi:hypothetical protein Pan258_03180 [Symmachiella dynata]|uniref:hypothetical protein n=1 Tax=Symmachiella dynata TaxID=2527995 RepID=UPI00118A3EAB|nr:hypothetical protein [Symmachiella dynata]QDT46300.1 hypothetical protein Pan258_03180 [Symmachiella dynata]